MAQPEDDRTGETVTPADDADRTTRAAGSDAVAPADGTTRTARTVEHDDTAVIRPAEPQPVMEPAVESTPAAPKRQGNRLAGTAWVLLAAGLFQVVYFGALAGLVALFVGPSVVPAQLGVYLASPFGWLPVLFFFLLFELTVLIFNRAGRFLYVVMSLVVGVLVYVASIALIIAMSPAGLADMATLQRAALDPTFVLTGLAAREVMLWTGVAIGARGTRVRKRNRAARDAYRAEVQDGQAA